MRAVRRILFVLPIIFLLSLLAFPVHAQSVGQSASPPSFTLTPEMLAGIAGAVLSLGFSYIPKLNIWYAAFDDTTKRGIMALLLLIVAAGAFGLQCASILSVGVTCTQAGALTIVEIWVAAIITNQSVYSLSPRTQAVQQVKADAATTK